jgi:hypothetical protein
MMPNIVRSVVLPVVFVAGVAVACGGTDTTAPSEDGGGNDAGSDGAGPVTDGTSPADGSRDATAITTPDAGSADDAACVLTETDAGTCNAIDVEGPMVAATCSMAEPPQAMGGVIEDGIYILQSFTYYGVCPTTPDIASTNWQICGNHWDVLQIDTDNADGGTFPPERFNFVTSVQSSTVEYTQTCGPMVTVGPRAYTATPGHLMFVYPDTTTPGRTFESVFVKQ